MWWDSHQYFCEGLYITGHLSYLCELNDLPLNIHQSRQLSRISRESHGFWQFLKAHGRETQSSRIFVNLTECCDRGIQFFFPDTFIFHQWSVRTFQHSASLICWILFVKGKRRLAWACLFASPSCPIQYICKAIQWFTHSSHSLFQRLLWLVSVTGFQMTIVCFTGVFLRSGIDFHRQLAFVQWPVERRGPGNANWLIVGYFDHRRPSSVCGTASWLQAPYWSSPVRRKHLPLIFIYSRFKAIFFYLQSVPTRSLSTSVG